MQVRFWGTRGSIAAPGKETARYGGNTSCVEVLTADGTHIVLDCGTGARALGLHLAESNQPLRLHLFIGHTHWDHIQGFPFFVPAFEPHTELNVYAPLGFQRGLEEALAGQLEYSYFPVKLRDLRSRIHPVTAAELSDRLRDAVRRAAPEARIVDREGDADFVVSGKVSRGGLGYRAWIQRRRWAAHAGEWWRIGK